MKDDLVYIRHILDEIEYLNSLCPTITYDNLLSNKTTEHAVTRSLEIIGEAAKNVPEKIKRETPGIPWKFMAGIRDKVIHGYLRSITRLSGMLSSTNFRNLNRRSVPWQIR